MPEAPQPSLEVTESQKGGIHRRLAEYDFSQVDFTKPELRRSIAAATRIILSYRIRPLDEQTDEESQTH